MVKENSGKGSQTAVSLDTINDGVMACQTCKSQDVRADNGM